MVVSGQFGKYLSPPRTLTLVMNWMLRGPVMLSSLAIFRVISSMRHRVYDVMSWGAQRVGECNKLHELEDKGGLCCTQTCYNTVSLACGG